MFITGSKVRFLLLKISRPKTFLPCSWGRSKYMESGLWYIPIMVGSVLYIHSEGRFIIICCWRSFLASPSVSTSRRAPLFLRIRSVASPRAWSATLPIPDFSSWLAYFWRIFWICSKVAPFFSNSVAISLSDLPSFFCCMTNCRICVSVMLCCPKAVKVKPRNKNVANSFFFIYYTNNFLDKKNKRTYFLDNKDIRT